MLPHDPLATSPELSTWPWNAQAFQALGTDFSTPVQPQPVQSPHWVLRNTALAQSLALPGLADPDSAQWQAVLPALAGNAVWADTTPVASVYSGHQFGMWAGQLGDGRALLLGTLESSSGSIEVQLKGAGRTPFSRMGDGRAVLRSSLREYLASEAMHALGIPTTRALALVGSATAVRREALESAAVLTRTAPSFIRFGHFEHFSHTGQHRQLRQLADFVLAGPMAQALTRGESTNAYAQLLHEVADRTALLMAQWLGVGFVHGVMNTDNMSILGLTLDYGPFQFLDGFAPNRITNHSDSQGRYTLQMQPSIAHWNLAKLAMALHPLLDSPEQGVAALNTYRQAFERHFAAVMTQKLGGKRHPETQEEAGGELPVQAIATQILTLLARETVDYTIFWRRLSECAQHGDFAMLERMFADKAGIAQWLVQYRAWHAQAADAHSTAHMLQSNPQFILRNYLAENAISRANEGDYQAAQDLVHVLQAPFDAHPDHAAKADFPPTWANDIEVSCSS